MKKKEFFCMRNGFVLVKPHNETTTLQNKIKVHEQKGKKDIMTGIVEVAQEALKYPDRCLCWFPTFAGHEILIEGERYLIVDNEDIMMTEKCK